MPVQDDFSQALAEQWEHLVELIHDNDTSSALMLWSSTAGKVANNFLGIDNNRHYFGRGQPHFVRRFSEGDFKSIGNAQNGYDLCVHSKRDRHLHLVLQRLQQWFSRLRILMKPGGTFAKSVQFLQLNLDACRSLHTNLDREDGLECELLDVMDARQPNDTTLIFTLTKIMKALQKQQEASKRLAKAASREPGMMLPSTSLPSTCLYVHEVVRQSPAAISIPA